MVKKVVDRKMLGTIDSQGRILIPADIRGRLHLEPNSEVELVVLGRELLVRKKDTALEERVMHWKEKLFRMKLKPGTTASDENVEETGKWVDEEYVEQKLGLR
jgi:AbrB family looped-hinge helix DNA binding protein